MWLEVFSGTKLLEDFKTWQRSALLFIHISRAIDIKRHKTPKQPNLNFRFLAEFPFKEEWSVLGTISEKNP